MITTDLYGKQTFDLDAFVKRQRAFGDVAFGPGQRVKGILNHIRKECDEVEERPNDLSEWVDIIVLALDGASRQGYTGSDIGARLTTTIERNEKRKWPDWRTMSENDAIEHID